MMKVNGIHRGENTHIQGMPYPAILSPSSTKNSIRAGAPPILNTVLEFLRMASTGFILYEILEL